MRRSGLRHLGLPAVARDSAGGQGSRPHHAQPDRGARGTAATDAQAWRGDYKTAKVAARTLKGTPQTNIRGVLPNLTSLAKRHLLGSRGYPAFLILRHNLEWFYEQRRSAPAYGTRTTFAGPS